MGRSSYTASTVSHLALLSGASSSCSASSSHASESGHNKQPETALLGEVHNNSNNTNNSNSTGVRLRREGVKDIPTLWAQKAFDPDDEALPTVEERFLEPYEEFPSLNHHDDDMSETDEDHYEDEEEEDDEEDDRDWDDEAREFEPEDHEIHGMLAIPEPRRSNAAIAELAQVLMGTQASSSDSNTPSQSSENRVWASHSEHVPVHELNDTVQDGEEQTESEYDEPPHGNGGYYDYGYSREDEQVLDRRSTPSIVDDFSPSAGVFHRHTLPFNLPNMDVMQIQRRSSNSITSTLAANDTWSTSTF